MKILKCAKEILKNTTEPYRQEIEYFISDYIHFGDGVDNQDLLAVFSKICEDGFNIQGFELYEIPHPSVYVFHNESQKTSFDICLHNFCKTGEISCIAYINPENEQRTASTISKAIQRYK